MWDATQAAHLVPDGNCLATLEDNVDALIAVLDSQYEAHD